MAALTQKTEKVCFWAYLLKNNQVRQFVKFIISSTSLTHVRNLSRPGLGVVKCFNLAP